MCRKSTSLCRNDLRIRRGIANLLDPNGMAGSEIVDAPCVSMSLERKSGTRIGYTDSIGWVRFDSFPDYRINACMSQFKETTTQLLLRKLGEHVGSTN